MQNLSQKLEHAPPTRLDLRPPSEALALEDKPGQFPSAISHRQLFTADASSEQSKLAAGVANTRIRPPLAEMVRHIQHEGLPVARLWENQSALVHIGLNQRGKPGLWLVQKIH